jgi:hypothetical protein
MLPIRGPGSSRERPEGGDIARAGAPKIKNDQGEQQMATFCASTATAQPHPQSQSEAGRQILGTVVGCALKTSGLAE